MADDDDFEDFGGFEAAEPSDTVVTASVPAVPSPWAVFTPAPSGAGDQTNTTATITKPQIPQDIVQSDRGQGDSAGVPAIDSENPESFPVSPGIHDQIEDAVHEIESQDDDLSQKLAEEKSAADKWLENLDFPAATSAEVNNEDVHTGAVLTSSDENLNKEQQEASKEEKNKLEQELTVLRESRISMETDLEKTKQELKSQKDKYEQLQTKHSADLETMRNSGMDALAVIVEEYKELCKVTVIEQKLACEQQTKNKLQAMTEQCEKVMEELQKQLQSTLEEQRTNQEVVLAEALANQQQVQQSTFEAALEEEKKSLRELVTKAMQEQREDNAKCVQQSIESLKDESKQISEEQKIWLSKVMEERLEVMKSSVLNDLVEKQKDNESILKEAVEKDGEKSRNRIKQLSEQTKEEMLDFIREQKQADGVVRQRQLSSLQLFLESAKSQVTDLLSTVSQDN